MKRLITTPLGILVAVIVVAGLGLLFLNNTGLHIQGFSLVSGGDIVIEPFDSETQIVIDNKPVSITDGTVTNIKPGKYEVIVFKDGFWPWVKEVVIESKESLIISPFFASKSVSGVIIGADDPEYGSIRKEVQNQKLPAEETKITSNDETVAVWSDGESIFVEKDDEVFEVFASANKIRNIAFYQNREDVLLVATRNDIFALEIDTQGGTQNFQPIYKGTSEPRFSVIDESQIYVLDGGLIFIVKI